MCPPIQGATFGNEYAHLKKKKKDNESGRKEVQRSKPIPNPLKILSKSKNIMIIVVAIDSQTTERSISIFALALVKYSDARSRISSLRLCHKKTSGDARYLYKKNNKINETFPHAHVMTHAVQCSLIKAD